MPIRPSFLAIRKNGIETIRFPELRRTYIVEPDGRFYRARDRLYTIARGTALDCRRAIYNDVCVALEGM